MSMVTLRPTGVQEDTFTRVARADAGMRNRSQLSWNYHEPRSWSMFFNTMLDHSAVESTCLMNDRSTLLLFFDMRGRRTGAVTPIHLPI